MADSLQDSRRLWADIGNRLSYEKQLGGAFKLVFSNQNNFHIFIFRSIFRPMAARVRSAISTLENLQSGMSTLEQRMNTEDHDQPAD